MIFCDDGCRGTSKTGSGLLLTALEHHDVRLVCRHCYHCHCRRVLDGLLGMDCIRFLFSLYILCVIIHAFRHGNACIHPVIHPLGRVCYLITLMKMLMQMLINSRNVTTQVCLALYSLLYCTYPAEAAKVHALRRQSASKVETEKIPLLDDKTE